MAATPSTTAGSPATTTSPGTGPRAVAAAPPPSPSVYVLQLREGMFYVGMTVKPVDERLRAHVDGLGAAWTRQYQVERLLERETRACRTLHDARFEEARKTAEMCLRKGIDRVRGAHFAMPDPSGDARRAMEDFIHHVCARHAAGRRRVYALKLCGGRFFVGRTAGSAEDAKALHLAGGDGSVEWTRFHPPSHLEWDCVVQSDERALVEEARTTAALCLEHGLDKVRGAHFTQVCPSEETKRAMVAFVAHVLGLDIADTARKLSRSPGTAASAPAQVAAPAAPSTPTTSSSRHAAAGADTTRSPPCAGPSPGSPGVRAPHRDAPSRGRRGRLITPPCGACEAAFASDPCTFLCPACYGEWCEEKNPEQCWGCKCRKPKHPTPLCVSCRKIWRT